MLLGENPADPRPSLDTRASVLYATPGELAGALPGADVLFVWEFTVGDALHRAWPAADALRWVHTSSAGVDRLTFPEMVASDVVLTNSRGVFDAPIAEYVLSMVLAFAKDLPCSLRLQGAREWRHRETETIAGKRAVVVGGGPIGAATSSLLSAAGLRTHLVGRTARPGVHGIDELDELLPETDYLVLAAPLTEQTRGMVNASLLAKLPPRARLINVGRGPLVAEADLVDALIAGRLAGAALDVFETEPLPTDSPLWTLPNVIVSPHMSGDAIGWRDALAELFTENLNRYRAGQALLNVVDKHSGYVRSSTAAETAGSRA